MQRVSIQKISEISVKINSTEDLHELLVEIMDAAKELLHSEGASLLLYDIEENSLIFDIVRGPKGSLLASKRVPLGQGIAGIVAESGEATIVNDAENDSRVLKNFDKETNFRTFNLIAVPLFREKELIGVLEVVNSLGREGFSQEDQELLYYFAQQAAIAIYNRKLYQDLRERMDELRCIYEISQSISSDFNFDKNIDNILYSIKNTLMVERLSLIMVRSGQLRIVSQIGLEGGDNELLSVEEQSIAGYVYKTGDPLLVRDIDRDLPVDRFQRHGLYQTKSFISIPITFKNKTIGVLNVADKQDRQPFDSFEFRVLSTVGNEISKAYESFDNQLNMIAMNELKKDLSTASEIQKNSLMRLPTQYMGMDIAYYYESCEAVGGDFYDMVTLGDYHYSFVIGDVSGKGVSAALFMEHVKTLLQSFIPRFKSPRTSIAELNDKLFTEKGLTLFVTIMIAQIEARSKQIRYASGGHNHQFLLHKNGQVESISGKGPPVGTFEEDRFQEFVLHYEPGDMLLLYTDGITEAVNSRYEEFGEERLIAALESFSQDLAVIRPQGIIDSLISQVQSFTGGAPLQDDLTLLVIRLV